MLWDRIGLQLPEGTIWGSYPRCYRNKSERGYEAHYYVGQNEYKSVYWDDSCDIRSFFGITDETSGSVQSEAQVHLVVFANLQKVFPNDDDRSDEKLRSLFLKALGDSAFGFEFVSVETGLQNVLAEYPGTMRDDRMKYVDFHPVHCFRINMNLYYDNGNNC